MVIGPAGQLAECRAEMKTAVSRVRKAACRHHTAWHRTARISIILHYRQLQSFPGIFLVQDQSAIFMIGVTTVGVEWACYSDLLHGVWDLMAVIAVCAGHRMPK